MKNGQGALLGWIVAAGCLSTGSAIAATLANHDPMPFLLTITEKGRQGELVVEQGQTIEFCFEGCLVALPNGNRTALFGNETIEISDGKINLK